MSPEALALAMLGLMVFAILVGFPTAFTLMALGVTFGFLGMGFLIFDLVVQRTVFVMTNEILPAIPLFLFMGYIVQRSGVLDQFFRSIQLMMGPLRGSLAIATVVTGAVFATATGVVGATVALLGTLALPAMLRARYDRSYAAGAVAASGTLGLLIPPSVLLILYSFISGIPVQVLYAGAILPASLLALLFLGYLAVRARVQPDAGPALPPEDRALPLVELVTTIVRGFVPLVVLLVIVLGAIFFGVATAGESAALGALGAIILAAAYRKLSFGLMRESVLLTLRTGAMIGWLLLGSSIFAAAFARLGGGGAIADFVASANLTSDQFFWIAQLAIFLLGWPLEWTEITVIFIPLVLPLLAAFKVEPVLFGIMAAMNQQASFLAPPVALSAYYLKGVAGSSVTLAQIFRGMLPFLLIQLAVMAALWFAPRLTYLPIEILYPR